MPHTSPDARVHVSRPRRSVKGVPRVFRSGVLRIPRLTPTPPVCDDNLFLSGVDPRASRFPRSELEHFSTPRECGRGGGHWHARGAFGPRATRLRAPVRAAAGGTPGSRPGARTRDISVEEGHPPRRRISGFWRGLAEGDPPSHPGARSWRRSAGHKLGALVSVSRARPLGLKCRPPTLT